MIQSKMPRRSEPYPTDDSLTIDQKYKLMQKVKHVIGQGTGFIWKETSHIRNSPSHKGGNALDIAPQITPKDWPSYSVSYRSDPILTKRRKLIRDIRDAVSSMPPTVSCQIGIFLETDHIHIGLFLNDTLGPVPVVFYVWEKTKSSYKDTKTRHASLAFEHPNEMKQ